ncbi:MAG: hypothetical protein ACU0B7_14945 [Paracoccaceae bacterium]
MRNSSKPPYYLKYQELGWLDRTLPDAPEFFVNETIKNLCRIVDAKAEIDQVQLGGDLRELATSFWVAAMSTPLGILNGPPAQSIDSRKRKILASIIKPTEKLIEALSDLEISLLSEWPDDDLPADPPDRDILRNELDRLYRRAYDLFFVLDDRKKKGTSLLIDFKLDLAVELTNIFRRYFPNLRPTRGGYDKTMNPSSEYHAFITFCAKEIFGKDFTFSGHILEQVEKLNSFR